MIHLGSEAQAALLGAVIGGAIALVSNYVMTRMQLGRGQRDQRRGLYLDFFRTVYEYRHVMSRVNDAREGFGRLQELKAEISRMKLRPDNIVGLAKLEEEVRTHSRALDEMGIDGNEVASVINRMKMSYLALFMYAPIRVRNTAIDLMHAAIDYGENDADDKNGAFDAAVTRFTWLSMHDVKAPDHQLPVGIAAVFWRLNEWTERRRKTI